MYPIATSGTLGSTTVVNFTSIPSTFTHLQVRISIPGSGGGFVSLFFNGDSTNTDYYFHDIEGSGSSASSGSGNFSAIGYTWSSYVNSYIADILDYANTNKYKTTRSLAGGDANGSGYVGMFSQLWSSTAAINAIQVSFNGGGLPSGSTVQLYGIKTA
jgi:hypothetical protein